MSELKDIDHQCSYCDSWDQWMKSAEWETNVVQDMTWNFSTVQQLAEHL